MKKRRRKGNTPEGIILGEILDWLDTRADLLVIRQYMGPVLVGGVKTKNPNAGFPDIFGYRVQSSALTAIGPMPFVMEVKPPGEKLDPLQIGWRDRFVAIGVQYIVARGLREAMLALNGGFNILE